MGYKKTIAIIVLVLIATTMRIFFLLEYPPLFTPDSGTYVETAKAIFGGEMTNYTGKREIFYPLILFLLRFNNEAVVIFQMFLGIIGTLLLYVIFRKLSDNEWIGFTAGLLYALSPSQIFLERAILAETVLTLLIAVSYLVFIKAIENSSEYSLIILLGMSTSVAALTKPQVIFLPLLFALMVGLDFYNSKDRKFIGAVYRFLIPLIPAAVLLGSGSFFNYRTTGQFTVSTAAGDVLILHTYPIIERAPDKYDELKKIYIKHREKKFKIVGRSTPVTMAEARAEAMEKLNLNFAEISRLLKEVSIYLIFHNPGEYLKSVLLSFKRFWYPTWLSGSGGVGKWLRSGEITKIIPAGIFALALLYSTLLFFCMPVLCLVSVSLRKACRFNFRIVAIYAMTLFAGIFQAVVTSANTAARYKMPFEPFIFGLAVIYSVGLWSSFKGSEREQVESLNSQACS